VGRLGSSGEYETIAQVGKEAKDEKKANEAEKPPLPQEDPKPPADTDPGVDPGLVTVDEFYVETIGEETLPDDAAADDYRQQAAEGFFKRLADEVISESGTDIDDFAKEIADVVKEVADAEEELGSKDVTTPTAPAPVPFEPLPGVAPDAVCTSLFEANDLALTDRRPVSVRKFNQPLVMIDAVLPGLARNTWLFGQKLEFQQEWRHAGFTLGELASSLSLLPGEELTIEVSSFQRTKQEIAQESDDTTRRQLSAEQRNTDERTCTNATAADNGWSVSASASVNFPVASASVSASAYGNSSERAEQSRRQLVDATVRSTNDISSRRAVRITQTSEAGSETTTTRRLQNPNSCQTVTFSFFQIVKLFDIQLRLLADNPVVLLPAIFPRFYGPQDVRRGENLNIRPTEVEIPVHLVEGWRSPAVFLTRYFEVDRELSRQISGWALRLRADVGADPAGAARLLAEALVVATRYLFGVNVEQNVRALGELFRDYCANILTARRRSADGYGPDKGTSVQLNTPGIYVDALRGRCIACTDQQESNDYVETMSAFEELRRTKMANELDDQEVERRKKLLDSNDLDPFEPAPVPS
jgi:hypothetical protein